MALDWNKLNNQITKLESNKFKGERPSAKFFKVSDGDNRVRVLTGWTEEGMFAGQFWREVAQHWNVSPDAKGPVLCTKRTPGLDGDCPICDFLEQLKNDNLDDIAAQELVKDLRAKTAYLLNIVDTVDPTYTVKDVSEFKKAKPDADLPFEVGDIKVQVYPATVSVFNQILSTIRSNEADITDPESGHDIVITKSGKGMNTRYTTNVVIKKSSAPAGADPHNLEGVGYVMEKEAMLELLASGPAMDYLTSTVAKVLPKTVAKVKADKNPDADIESGAIDDLAAKLRAAAAG